MDEIERKALELLEASWAKFGVIPAHVDPTSTVDAAAMDAIAAALRSAQVPEEATDAMCQAAHEAQMGHIEPDCQTSYGPCVSMNAIYRAMYRAMLAAAPSAEG